jgi:hypothetical protein
VAYLMEFNWMCLHHLSFHLQPLLKDKLFVWTAGKGDIVWPTSMSWTKQFDIVKGDIVLPTSLWSRQSNWYCAVFHLSTGSWSTVSLGNTSTETVSCLESALLWSAKPCALWECPCQKPMQRKRIRDLEVFCNLLPVPLFS